MIHPSTKAIRYGIVVIALVLLLWRCSDGWVINVGSRTIGVPPSGPITHANPRHSGYTPGTQQWVTFIQCWQARHQEKVAAMRGREYDVYKDYTVLKDGKLLASENTSENAGVAGQTQDQRAQARAVQIAQLEYRLGVQLPQSYKDLLMVYEPGLQEPHPGGITNGMGLFALHEVKYLKQLDPALIEALRPSARDASDLEYFIYGTQQGSAYIRSQYTQDAIVIGKYSRVSSTDYIVLHPRVRTADGEMEVSMFEWAGQFRTPTFAETMRQLSADETTKHDHAPPHSQMTLKSTCAVHLPLKDVWWQ